MCVVPANQKPRLSVDGKFFRSGAERVFLKMVTYGPFPEPRPPAVSDDREQMEKIASAGFNAVRVYEEPGNVLLDAALEAGLHVFVGLSWEYHRDFVSDPSIFSAAQIMMSDGLGSWGAHPAVAGVFVANEIPSDMVRWMGLTRVRQALEDLIALGRDICPDKLYAYSNYPTTEYLEPANADFTAMNVYLENRDDFASYLPRLHNVAGDRPVLLSEFGVDTQGNDEQLQRDALLWYVDESLSAGMGGVTVYAWSDHWQKSGVAIDDWSFGLHDRDGVAKPSLAALGAKLKGIDSPGPGSQLHNPPSFSVVVCTYNGAARIGRCLEALQNLDYPDFEIVVVDDGSTDKTAELVGRYRGVRLIESGHAGLSAARNRGAREAKGEIIAYTDDDCRPDVQWLQWLADAFVRRAWDACGGPNLPPRPVATSDGGAGVMDEVVVASAPGAPSHVLSGDDEAEHLPGCNLAVRKNVFEAVGGFCEDYWIAGDDVDFCWRLQEAGFRIGFSAAAFVWHRRRTNLWGYFKQQYQYGKAEALLMRDYPERFYRGYGALWKGCVYTGGAMTVARESFIYHGLMGTGAYQQIVTSMQPLRPIPSDFSCLESRTKLALANAMQPRIRAWARWFHSSLWHNQVEPAPKASQFILADDMREFEQYHASWWSKQGVSREQVLDALLGNGWEPVENDSDWDLSRDGMRAMVAVEVLPMGSVFLHTKLKMDVKRRGHLPSDFISQLEAAGLVRCDVTS